MTNLVARTTAEADVQARTWRALVLLDPDACTGCVVGWHAHVALRGGTPGSIEGESA